MFVKYMSETQIETAPKNKGSIFNYHLNEEVMRADGYKPLWTASEPSDMVQPEIRYKDELDAVVQFYVDTYIAPPEPSYAEKRAAEYPSMAEQLDMMYWDGVNGTTIWADTIAVVKTKYPKPVDTHSIGGCESDETVVDKDVQTDSKQASMGGASEASNDI